VLWERLKCADRTSLYHFTLMRAVSAVAISEARTPGADATRLANEEADLAMAWLKQAVVADFQDAAHMAKDKDHDALRH
jgi:hypothetical protein